MTDIILVYDDLNIGSEEIPGLDYFFYSCACDMAFNIIDNSYNISELNGNKISLKNINELIDSKSSSFLFIAYSHGIEDALLHNEQNDFYIKAGINDHKFNGCIFYTWSCLTGKTLGKSLIDKNCMAYIGYSEPIMAGTGEIDTFISSANYGLILLFKELTVKEVFNGMYKKYNELIDYLVDEKKDLFIANFLRRNRDALVYFGDDNVTINRIC